MQVYAAGLIVILVWVVCVLRGRGAAVAMVGALFPFGMMNVFRLGGFSFVADDFVAAACICLFALFIVTNRPRVRLPRAGLPLLLLAVYALFASFFLVRIFSGSVDVFTFNRLYDGVRISHNFLGSLLPLAPSSTNLSQSAYFLLDISFFFVAYAVARRFGTGILIQGLRIGACINIALGLMQIVGLGDVLSVIKTADYAVLDHHKIAGLPRLTGGFSEASAFGGVSAAMASFFLIHGLFARQRADVVIGLLSSAMAVLALSSSGLVGVFVMIAFLVGCGFWQMQTALPARTLYVWSLILVGLVTIMTIGVGLALMDTQSLPYRVIDNLILSKADSASGLERGAMARNGFEVFRATWGLGAGLGSAMANGHLSAVLAAMGLPGLVLIVTFYAQCFFGAHRTLSPRQLAVRRATQCYFLVSLTVALMGSFSASPGLQRIYVAAIALGCLTTVQALPRARLFRRWAFASRRTGPRVPAGNTP